MVDLTEEYSFSPYEEDYRTLVIQAEAGFCRLDSCYKIEFVNPWMIRMLNYDSRDELIGRSFLDIVAAKDHGTVEIEYKKRQERNPGNYRVQFRRKDGSTFPAMITSSPLFEKGVFNGSFGIIKDIPDDRRDPLLNIRDHGRCTYFAEQFPIAVVDIALDLSIRYMNGYARDLLGAGNRGDRRRDTLRRNIKEECVHRISDIVRQSLAGKTQKPFLMDLVSASGARLPALWFPMPVSRDAEAEEARFIILNIRDMFHAYFKNEDVFSNLGLTPREKAVGKYLVSGHLYKEIAFDLGISLSTVRTLAQRLYRKLKIHTKNELVDIVLSRIIGCDENTLMKVLRNSLITSIPGEE